jgi:ankyrin repeat protein
MTQGFNDAARPGLDEAMKDALRRKDFPALMDLVSRGADINSENAFGNTALMLSIIHGNAEVSRFFIEAGASLEQENDGSSTALILAAIHQRPDVVRMLIEAGVNTQKKNRRGETALAIAEEEGGSDEIAALLRRADPAFHQKRLAADAEKARQAAEKERQAMVADKQAGFKAKLGNRPNIRPR